MKKKLIAIFILFILLSVGLMKMRMASQIKNEELEDKYIEQIVAVVVPHHDIVKAERRVVLEEILQKRPNIQSIVLISPDHFSDFQKDIKYSDRDWQLSNGVYQFNKEMFDNFSGFTRDNKQLLKDHGVYNILPDLKEYWPNSKIIPFIIGQEVEFSDLTELSNLINENCTKDCLLVASVDFSHFLPRSLADIHDQEALSALQEMQIPWNHDLEVDSPQSLYLLTQYAQYNNSKYFHLKKHTNSGWLRDLRDYETTTHIMGYYISNENEQAEMEEEVMDQHTFTLGANLDKERDKKNLGDRFFYGVDKFTYHLGPDYRLAKNLLVMSTEGVKQKCRINLEANEIVFHLGSDCALAGSRRNSQVDLLVLPIEDDKDGSKILIIGQKKSEYLTKLFKDLHNSTSSIVVDEENGMFYNYSKTN